MFYVDCSRNARATFTNERPAIIINLDVDEEDEDEKMLGKLEIPTQFQFPFLLDPRFSRTQSQLVDKDQGYMFRKKLTNNNNA